MWWWCRFLCMCVVHIVWWYVCCVAVFFMLLCVNTVWLYDCMCYMMHVLFMCVEMCMCILCVFRIGFAYVQWLLLRCLVVECMCTFVWMHVHTARAMWYLWYGLSVSMLIVYIECFLVGGTGVTHCDHLSWINTCNGLQLFLFIWCV